MQFYLNGFHTGDPERTCSVDPMTESLPSVIDVLIVGSGPAGLVLATQLAAFPEITTRVVERRPGPLLVGQADGIGCRSMEMFEAFGLSDRILREAYWVNETVFWGPSEDGATIERRGRVQDVEDGLSEFPHVIVNQARIQQHLLDAMTRSNRPLEPDYGWEVVHVVRDEDEQHPVIVTLRRVGAFELGEERTVRTRYLVGCDGARSIVRSEIGQALQGDSARQLWGVMDVLAVTDLPDVRFKAVIQSAHAGNVLLIPREGGYLVRLYIELDELGEGERASDRDVSIDTLIEAANRILRPFVLDVREVAWWSAYEVGQRLTDKFDDASEHREPRIFIAGDACHTHSPKAGQGMNVSMQDAFNIGWKLAAVLLGRSPRELLASYSAERHSVAKQLIENDKRWAGAMHSRPEVASLKGRAETIQRTFLDQGRWTAGVATRYAPSSIVGTTAHQHLATGYPIGERFHSARVRRIADALELELGHVARADGRWRIYAFGDSIDPRLDQSALRQLADYLFDDPTSVLARYTLRGQDVDAVIDFRAILQQGHDELAITELPNLFAPHKGALGLIDYEKSYSSRHVSGEEIFEARGIDRGHGALVIVRPDQYVAQILPLHAREEISAFFDEIFTIPRDASALAPANETPQ